jgi:hypothetical protein
MPSYHPITVHVVNVANGEPFEEYKVSHNGNDVVCYIESTADTEFRLDINLAKDFRNVNSRYSVGGSVDGQLVDSFLLGDFSRTWTTGSIGGRYIGNGKMRKLKFASTRFSGKQTCSELASNLSRGRWD